MPWNLDYNEWPGPYDQSTGIEFSTVVQSIAKVYGSAMADFTKNMSSITDTMKLTLITNPGVKSHGPRPAQTYDHHGRRRY